MRTTWAAAVWVYGETEVLREEFYAEPDAKNLLRMGRLGMLRMFDEVPKDTELVPVGGIDGPQSLRYHVFGWGDQTGVFVRVFPL